MTAEEKGLLCSILETLNTVAYTSIIQIEKQGNNDPKKVEELEGYKEVVTGLIEKFKSI